MVAYMSFWYKNVIFALILIGLAYYFLSNPGLIKDLKEQFDETSLELSSGGDESSGSADGKELEKIEQELLHHARRAQFRSPPSSSTRAPPQ